METKIKYMSKIMSLSSFKVLISVNEYYMLAVETAIESDSLKVSA